MLGELVKAVLERALEAELAGHIVSVRSSRRRQARRCAR